MLTREESKAALAGEFTIINFRLQLFLTPYFVSLTRSQKVHAQFL